MRLNAWEAYKVKFTVGIFGEICETYEISKPFKKLKRPFPNKQ